MADRELTPDDWKTGNIPANCRWTPPGHPDTDQSFLATQLSLRELDKFNDSRSGWWLTPAQRAKKHREETRHPKPTAIARGAEVMLHHDGGRVAVELPGGSRVFGPLAVHRALSHVCPTEGPQWSQRAVLTHMPSGLKIETSRTVLFKQRQLVELARHLWENCDPAMWAAIEADAPHNTVEGRAALRELAEAITAYVDALRAAEELA